MTASEFVRHLVMLNNKGYKSCAYLISYNGETMVRHISTSSKVLYCPTLCNFKSCICNQRTKNPTTKISKEKEMACDYLKQHWDDLDFEILELDKKHHIIPQSVLHNLYEKIKPTLQLEQAAKSAKRLTVGGYKGKKREYRPALYERNRDRRIENRDKIAAWRRKYAAEYPERIRQSNRKQNIRRKKIREERRQPTLEKYQKMIKLCQEQRDPFFEQSGLVSVKLIMAIFGLKKQTVTYNIKVGNLAATKVRIDEAGFSYNMFLVDPLSLFEFACRKEWL